MSDVRLELRFKNATLYRAIEADLSARQIPVKRHGLVAAFCRLHHLREHVVGGLLTLRLKPLIRRSGRGARGAHHLTTRPICERLAEILQQDVWTLFPLALYQMDWPVLAVDAPVEKVVALVPGLMQTALTLPPSQDETVATRELRELLVTQLRTLTPREQRIMQMRFGIETEESSLDEVAHAFGVGVKRIRQIQAKALRKLRHPSRAKHLLPYDAEAIKKARDASQAVDGWAPQKVAREAEARKA